MSRIIALVTGPPGTVAGAGITIGRNSPVAALVSATVSPGGVPADGRYESPHTLGAGNYLVVVTAPAREGRPAMWAMRDVTLTSAEPVTVPLDLQPTLTGKGRVVADAAAGAPPAFGDVRVALQPVTPGAWGGASSATADAAGAFTLSGIVPTRVRVAVTLSAATATGWMLESVTMGDRDVTDLPIDIGAGDQPSFVVTLTNRLSELSGALLDASGRPSTDYFVLVVPADRRYWLPQSRRIVNTRPDARGQFVFRGLPPGDYRLAATTDLIPRDLQDVGALEALLSQSLAVTVGAGEKKTMDIRVQ
jgi:hypothetical protein